MESILSQTYKDFDYYIQFDGAIDASVEVYLRGLKDERIKISARSENKGLAYSLNELLQIFMPKGYEYIARMDADDDRHRSFADDADFQESGFDIEDAPEDAGADIDADFDDE